MNILEGLLYINDIDVYKRYGAFLCEDKQGDMSNYEELLKPASAKAIPSVSFPEQNGEETADTIVIKKEPRDVSLFIAIQADNVTQWFSRYNAFLAFLRSGWLNIRLTELDVVFRMYYKSCKQYSQLTSFEGSVCAQIKITLREPKPLF